MIKYCQKCKKYTLKEDCQKCKNKTISKSPAKFAPEKNYSIQRLKIKGYLWKALI